MLSNLKNLDVPSEQTQTKPEKGTEFKLNVTMETFPFVNDLKTDERQGMIGFVSLQVHISFLGQQNRMKHL